MSGDKIDEAYEKLEFVLDILDLGEYVSHYGTQEKTLTLESKNHYNGNTSHAASVFMLEGMRKIKKALDSVGIKSSIGARVSGHGSLQLPTMSVEIDDKFNTKLASLALKKVLSGGDASEMLSGVLELKEKGIVSPEDNGLLAQEIAERVKSLQTLAEEMGVGNQVKRQLQPSFRLEAGFSHKK